jgi:hypothetical protein
MIPGEFAKETTTTALANAEDISYWMLEPGVIQSVSVRCTAADSGATPASVQLVINGAPAGAIMQVLASALTSSTPAGVNIATGDRIEIAVNATGSNKDSENLRMFIVAEV